MRYRLDPRGYINFNEVHDSLLAWPDGFDARLAIAFAREEATEPDDERYHFIELRRFVGRGPLEDERGLPLIGLKQQSGIKVRAGTA